MAFWAERRGPGRWRARWHEGQHKRSRDGFTNKREAENYAQDRERDYLHPAGGLTWGQWEPYWLAERRVEASTWASDLPRLTKWLRPYWSAWVLAEITPAAIRTWVASLSRAGQSPASVTKLYRLLSASLRAAVEAGELAANPAHGVRLPRTPPTIGVALTREQFTAALRWINPPYQDAVLALPYTGMRFGELAGLHWARVDESARRIRVFDTLSEGHVKAYPKGRRLRSTLLPLRLLERLERPPDWQRPCGLVHLDPDGKPTHCPGTLVFTGPNGAPLSDGNLSRRHWQPAVRLAGLPHVRLHDLRHTFATWLVTAGVPLEEVAALLGHSSVWVTQRYQHLAPGHGERSMTALDADYLAELPPKLPPSQRLRVVPKG